MGITSGNTCHAIFHASEASGSEEGDLNIFPFIWFKPRTPWEDSFGTLGPLFEHTKLKTTRQCYIPNFKQLSLEKKICKYILLANPGYPGIVPFWKTLVKDH